MPTSKLVKLANNATSARLSSLISTAGYEFTDSESKCRVSVHHSSELHKAMRQAIWDLFESNMHDFYLNSPSFGGWNPKAKKKELFNPKSRFIIVHPTDPTTLSLLAFSMFRFEYEEDELVLYCYELQVAATSQGMGIGKKLMNDLNTLGRAFNMEKIMLTVFKGFYPPFLGHIASGHGIDWNVIANSSAMQFYKHIGFHLDPSSPNYIEDDDGEEELDPDDESDVDYEILSKILQ